MALGAGRVCDRPWEEGDSLLFPAFDDEWTWHPVLRTVLYSAGMAYFFMGVAIIADTFMASIEKVTSKKKKVRKADGSFTTEKVWNETVATLTLMALGSSAPEIFLAVIDIVKKEFHFSDLGPSTIVGSAAFNLFCIVAVCISAIPAGEARFVKNLPALYITAFFSIIAYVWVAFVLSAWSENEVEIWEALVTFLMLPLLVGVSYKVDKGDLDHVLRRLSIPTTEASCEEVERESTLAFPAQVVTVDSSPAAQTLTLAVERTGSFKGACSCRFYTEEVTAVPGWDYEANEGVLAFEEGETRKEFSIGICPRKAWKASTEFLVVLEEAECADCAVGFNPDDDGGEDQAILTVTFAPSTSEAALGGFLSRLDAAVGVDHCRRLRKEWREQVVAVFYCNGGPEEQAEAGASDWVLHWLSLPWRVLFSACPPTCLAGGWACFLCSLFGIGSLTAGVSDLAELFGCVIDCPDIITAITFVALGTSMPDLFASLTAAKEDPFADASIVNVTGSNSVNVFLGLGLPWTMAAVYWRVSGPDAKWLEDHPGLFERHGRAVFAVEARDLGFSVVVFCYASVVAIALLHLRRRWLGAELGGPARPKAAGSACLMAHWLLFVVVVSWRALRLEHGALADGEQAGVLLATLLVSVLAIVPTVVLTYQDRSQAEEGTAGDKEEKRAEGLGLPDVTLCEEATAREVLAEMATALPSGATATPETCSESDWKDLKACDQDVPEDTDATSTPPSTREGRVVFV